MELIITRRVSNRIAKEASFLRMISLRKLSATELKILRHNSIKRFYLPRLDDTNVAQFFSEFDVFWNKVICQYPDDHFFWRNSVSSKMQAWDNSIGQLCLTLYTLTRMDRQKPLKLLFVCDNVETERICITWARQHNWKYSLYRHSSYWLKKIVQELANMAWFHWRILSIFINKWHSRHSFPKVYAGSESVLLSSLFYLDSFGDGFYQDQFLGPLHRYISTKDSSCVYICQPLVQLNESVARTISSCSEVPVFTPYLLLSWRQLVRILATFYFRKIQFYNCTFRGCDFSELLAWQSRSFSSHLNLSAELFFLAVSRLCKKHMFERLIYSFEGNVHERACIQAFKAYSSGMVIGYSQAVIFPLNLKLRCTSLELQNKPRSDSILCTGPYAKELLQRVRNQDFVRLRSGCALRTIPCIERDDGVHLTSRQILISFDGMGLVSVTLLLEWLLECEEIFKNFTVCLRFHPDIDVHDLMGQSIDAFPKYFRISKDTLAKDLKESFCVLYRHSSVGLQALRNGLPAVHLAVNTPISGDPLEEFDAYKWTVHKQEELDFLLQKIASIDSKTRDTLARIAHKFSRDYFSDCSDEAMKKFVD